MKKGIIYIFILLFFVVINGCKSHYNNFKPAIVLERTATKEQNMSKKIGDLNVIGEVEPVYVLPIKKPFTARIDTGAETSSIDAKNISFFERDGEKWVSFDVISRNSGEKYHFEKKIRKRIAVRRTGEFEHRKMVDMTIRFGGENITTGFSLTFGGNA